MKGILRGQIVGNFLVWRRPPWFRPQPARAKPAAARTIRRHREGPYLHPRLDSGAQHGHAPGQTAQVPPHKIIGNVYTSATRTLSAVLITTTARQTSSSTAPMNGTCR